VDHLVIYSSPIKYLFNLGIKFQRRIKCNQDKIFSADERKNGPFDTQIGYESTNHRTAQFTIGGKDFKVKKIKFDQFGLTSLRQITLKNLRETSVFDTKRKTYHKFKIMYVNNSDPSQVSKHQRCFLVVSKNGVPDGKHSAHY
jgi:hypothetical protein